MGKLEQQLRIMNRLHILRAEQRLTQEQLAKAIGMVP